MKMAVIGSKLDVIQMLQCIYNSKVFRDWSIIKHTKNNSYLSDIYYLLQCLKQHLTAFVGLVYRCGIEKRTFSEMFLPCRVPSFRGLKVVKHGGHQGISFLFID